MFSGFQHNWQKLLLIYQQDVARPSMESCTDTLQFAYLHPVSYEWKTISQWTRIWKKGWQNWSLHTCSYNLHISLSHCTLKWATSTSQPENHCHKILTILASITTLLCVVASQTWEIIPNVLKLSVSLDSQVWITAYYHLALFLLIYFLY